VKRAQRRGIRVALDASAPGLRSGWSAGPDLLRINREEAAEALGVQPRQVEAPPRNAPGLTRLGVISDGPDRLVAWNAEGSRWVVFPPAVRAVNPIGCGDTMLAGLIASLQAKRDLEEALRMATALAAAQAESLVAGRPDPERGRSLEPRVRIDN
jgi:tagatose 6-phosphate kinase